ncbi:hypothetical protein T484DRAFT_1796249 [Baffinella frigidus]|nr:hypothetical protein T484DRAFT_1796249 [Cryptophyta sp. CCMP2293]
MTLASGKRVVPSRVVDAVMAAPWVSQAVVVGEGKEFPVLLVVPIYEKMQVITP